MKLTEAMPIPLFESFKDLKAFIDKTFDYSDPNQRISLEFLKDYQPLMQRQFDDYPRGDVNNTGTITEIFRWAMKHPLLPGDMKRNAQTGVIIRYIRQDGLAHGLFLLSDWIETIYKESKSPAREKPHITKVSTGKGWSSFELHNYSAARMICHKFNTNFCIGSSDMFMFSEYGVLDGRRTYAIIIDNRRVVIVNSGSNGFLVTAQNNDNEFSDISMGHADVMAVLSDFGWDMDAMKSGLKSVIPSRYHSTIDAI